MLINTTAYRASSGGVLGVNEFDHYACEPSLILNKASELVECPRVLLSPLALSNRDSVSDTAQVLQSDTPSSAFCLFNNPLANCMVDIRGEALFLPGAFFDKPQGCLGAFGLELGAKFGMALAETVQMPTRVNCPIRVRCYVHYAKVYAQKTVRLIWYWLRGINHNCQVEDTITENEVGLPHLSINPRFLVCPYSDRDNLATAKSQNRNLVQPLPGEDALVVDHSRMGPEEVLRLSVRLVALRNFGYRSYSHLSRKFVVLTKMAIGEMLKIILPECAAFKGNLGCVIAGFVKPLHRLKESLVLLWVRGQLNHQSLVHSLIVDHIVLQVKYFLKGRIGEFLCPLKGAVSFA